MQKDYTRRDFLKVVGAGVATVALGNNLVGCGETEEETIPQDRLNDYHVFLMDIEDDPLYKFWLIREQRYLDDYMYLYLNIAEDKYFYDNVLITVEDIDVKERNLEHIPFKPLMDYFDMIDLGNAVDVIGAKYERKYEYTPNDIYEFIKILEKEDEIINSNEIKKTKVKKLA